ncbi:hypothetical protein [Saccharibacter floricola]|uniref:Uncharacterized protein n=1 Tax=Saccharibacter floricola DSM 15669 TaxID=1123227 RepID=A0ABQ0P1F3_9PROT|nr:hypothetical protein [Saccharibacter floricola]GBQ09069.1 hypothetical protein AA15669_2043 [Saccharibacter floricola DSM 15669]
MLDTTISVSRKQITDAQADLISREDLESHYGLERLFFTGVIFSSAFRTLAKVSQSKELADSIEGVSKALDTLSSQAQIERQKLLSSK